MYSLLSSSEHQVEEAEVISSPPSSSQNETAESVNVGVENITSENGNEDEDKKVKGGGTTSSLFFSANTPIQNRGLVPISRPPTKGRDVWYIRGFLFFYTSLVMGMLYYNFYGKDNDDLVSDSEENYKDIFSSTILLYGQAGNWTSMLMIATVIGSSLGVFISILVALPMIGETIIQLSSPSAIVLQIAVSFILLILIPKHWYVGTLGLVFAVSDSFHYRISQENLRFSVALLDLAISVLQKYGYRYSLAVLLLVSLQSCLLLLWGAISVTLLSNMPIFTLVWIVPILAISFYWSVQLFHSIMATMTSGCVLWYYIANEDVIDLSRQRVFLYLRLSMTSNIGSLCKGALYSPLAQMLLSIREIVSPLQPMQIPHPSIFSLCGLKNAVSKMTAPFVQSSLENNRLAYCYIAIYGVTFSKAADLAKQNPTNISLILEDTTSFMLSTICTGVSCAFAALFTLLNEREEGKSWPIFFFISFLLAYSGISLSLHCLRSAVDAIVIAFTSHPQRLSEESNIIYHRFLRLTEADTF